MRMRALYGGMTEGPTNLPQHSLFTTQGRGAEHLLARVLVKPGLRVPSNLYFTTSREHVVLAGGIWEDIAVPEARQPESTYPFKVRRQYRSAKCRLEPRSVYPSKPVCA